MRMTYKLICDQQQAWAYRQGITFDDKGYTSSLSANLFLPLLPEVRKPFLAGKGGELGGGGGRVKMKALHSSSALVVNVFQYWVNRNVSDIASACGTSKGMTEMHFERTHLTPLRGNPPHLDVEFLGDRLRPPAIESKFTEPYHRHTRRRIKDKYLDPSLWAQLPRCGELVRRIREEERGRTSFAYLDAPQLVKHMLGLTIGFGPAGFDFAYLYYEMSSPEAKKHRRELEEFKRQIGDEVRFRDMTYQELFAAIRRCGGAGGDYVSYLAERYFPCLGD